MGEPMIRLGIDTSTALVQVAICDDAEPLAVFDSPTGLRHGEDLAPAIAQTLTMAALKVTALREIVVGVGPGPFTGLRVGLITARTMAFALGIPVIGVCSLDVLAADVVAEEFLVATDARRKEVYLAHYRRGSRVSGPTVLKPGDVASALPVAGEGALLYPEHFPNAIGPTHPGGATLCRVVAEQSVELLPPEPLYLRRPDTAAPRPPKRVS